MHRRLFLTGTAATTACTLAGVQSWSQSSGSSLNDFQHIGPVRTFEPVVGDGQWIWREPPTTQRGYLEPRSFSLNVGIELEGTSSVSDAMASTPVPVIHPEQTIDDFSLETVGCEAAVRELAPGAGQLIMQASNIEVGQTVKAIAHYKLTLFKQYHAFERDQFPAKQPVAPAECNFALGDSPGIQVRSGPVRKLTTQIAQSIEHPWDKAQAFVEWIRASIHPQGGPYTSVLTAIQKRVGDCEEMSALFVAFCRASNIPARLVWVPNHNWAEFYLVDHEKKGHWIPVHPACYHWFGWTGAHELVIQKGDRIKIPEQSNPSRLLADWMRSNGRPKAKYLAELTPLASSENDDAGPGTSDRVARR
jgi:hypothetical protein